MAEKMPIRIRERAVASGGTYDYVKSEIVPPGEIWCLQGIAYENETGARGTFRRYIEGHGYNHYIAEHQSPGLGELNAYPVLKSLFHCSLTSGNKLPVYLVAVGIEGQNIGGNG